MLKVVAVHWTLHPDKAEGLYYDKDGKPRSPWYDKETAEMTRSAIAREYDMCDQLAVEGVVFPEFDRRRHVFTGDYEVNPNFPVIRTIDYGACNAVLFLQRDHYGGLIVFKELVVLKNGNASEQAQRINAYSSTLGNVKFQTFDDPAGENDKWVSGTASVEIMQKNGIFPTHEASKASRERRKTRNELIHAILQTRLPDFEEKLRIHESCKYLISALENGYRYKEGKDGSINIDDIDEKHPYEDVIDCLGMAVMETNALAAPRQIEYKIRKGNRYTGY